jgi:hypothetical protein
MKVDLMYSIQYIPHPWDKEAREAGTMVYCLCREVRMPVDVGKVRGTPISYDLESNSEGRLFDEFCALSIDLRIIEPTQQTLDAKGLKIPRQQS